MANYFGICEWCLPETGVEAIYHAARLGFDGVQLTECGGWEAGFPLLQPARQSAYRRARDETGIIFQALHLWSLCRLACMIHPVDSPAGAVGQQSIRKAIEACVALEIPVLMLTSGFLCQIKNETDFLQFTQHVKLACEAADAHGVRIVVESALDQADICRMRQMVGASLKICYDTFNPVRFHMASPVQDIEALGTEAIDHFHLKDGPENMIGCSLLGEGVGRFDAVAAAIQNTGYSGWFITENYYAQSPLNRQGRFDEVAARDLATMRRTFGGGT